MRGLWIAQTGHCMGFGGFSGRSANNEEAVGIRDLRTTWPMLDVQTLPCSCTPASDGEAGWPSFAGRGCAARKWLVCSRIVAYILSFLSGTQQLLLRRVVCKGHALNSNRRGQIAVQLQ